MKQFFPLVSALVLALIAIAAYVFLVAEVDSYVIRITRAVDDARGFAQKDVALQAAQVLLTEVAPLSENLSAAVISENNAVEVIELLEDVARGTGPDLSITNVAINGVGSWSHHERVDVSFVVVGSFTELTRLGVALEALPRAVRLESGAFERTGPEWSGGFSVSFIKEKP